MGSLNCAEQQRLSVMEKDSFTYQIPENNFPDVPNPDENAYCNSMINADKALFFKKELK